MHPLSNFNVLKLNLKRLNRLVSVLKFEYNGITCYMVFHVLDKPIDGIWSIELTFHNPKDKTYDFECYANQQRMSFEFCEPPRLNRNAIIDGASHLICCKPQTAALGGMRSLTTDTAETQRLHTRQ